MRLTRFTFVLIIAFGALCLPIEANTRPRSLSLLCMVISKNSLLINLISGIARVGFFGGGEWEEAAPGKSLSRAFEGGPMGVGCRSPRDLNEVLYFQICKCIRKYVVPARFQHFYRPKYPFST